MVTKDRNVSMLTAKQAADLLNVHINTVRRWSKQGILKGYRIGPRGDRRFKREDLAILLLEETKVDNEKKEDGEVRQ